MPCNGAHTWMILVTSHIEEVNQWWNIYLLLWPLTCWTFDIHHIINEARAFPQIPTSAGGVWGETRARETVLGLISYIYYSRGSTAQTIVGTAQAYAIVSRWWHGHKINVLFLNTFLFYNHLKLFSYPATEKNVMFTALFTSCSEEVEVPISTMS